MNVLEHWFEEVWNKQNTAAIDELWVTDKVVHGLAATDGGQVESKAAFKVFHKTFCTAFPDIHVEVEESVAEVKKLAVRVVVTGTHTGPGLHKKPVPTGKAVRFGGMCIVHVKDGKVEESWNNFDFLSMYEQLA